MFTKKRQAKRKTPQKRSTAKGKAGPIRRKVRARPLPKPSAVLDLRGPGTIVRFMQTLAELSTNAAGSLDVNKYAVAPTTFTAQMATLGAAFNNIEFLGLKLHYTRLCSYATAGELALAWDPDYDTAHATTNIDEVLRHYGSKLGPVYEDKVITFQPPLHWVKGPVPTASTTNCYPANPIGVRLFVNAASFSTRIGRLWLEALVRLSGPK